ncbi:unnamed protein product [Enterobius vermicularis]|uniref:Glycosyltransferase family 92 protein n=1 Tax=Enterobius vermicularis TaxID=51028 RepID=A0A0N4VE49_ENTVE|nr:unnamed protein product [Enterobius vermicularis]
MHFRTINVWQLKNIGDSILVKRIGRRPIILGAFHRLKKEQNVAGDFVVFQFLGDIRKPHSLYCYSTDLNGKQSITRAHVQRIHEGKRAANDICTWAGHLAECEVAREMISTRPDDPNPTTVSIEQPHVEQEHRLVVCIAPLYTYTGWQTLLLGIEGWLALGATKIIIPVQTASADVMRLLQAYEKLGIVVIRPWPIWPVLSDVNPNGVVLSRGIEESHVNCLHYVKPFARLVVFTDLDDMLMPKDLSQIHPTSAIEILENLLIEHPQAGSFLFEHKDVQLLLPNEVNKTTLEDFSFDFLLNTQAKTECSVRRIKTRVAAVASRLDSINMHESGIHRFGAVQVRVPCRKAHFSHFRHTHKKIASALKVDPTKLSFDDYDYCMASISNEMYTLVVSRCLTPHVCFSRVLCREMECVAVLGKYNFSYYDGDFVIVLDEAKFVRSEPNCESPPSVFVQGNHFYIP